MSRFIYAIDAAKGNLKKSLEDAGLTDLIGGATVAQRGCMTGPGGRPCTLLSIGEETKELYYKPDEQTWAKALSGKYHIGFYSDRPPTAAELQRPEQIAGHEVTINGQQWRIPLARIFPEGTMLPQSLLMGPEGKLIKQIIPRYAEFSARAEKLKNYIFYITGIAEEKADVTEEELWLAAAEALGLNYYAGADEINAMQLLTTETMRKIFGAVVDMPTILKVMEDIAATQKKTEDGAEGEQKEKD